MLVDFFLHLKSRKLPVSTKEFLTLLEAVRPRQAFRIYFERDGQLSFTDLSFR